MFFPAQYSLSVSKHWARISHAPLPIFCNDPSRGNTIERGGAKRDIQVSANAADLRG